MQEAQGGRADLTPEESWHTIHETVGRVQSSMYVAGMATILLLWGVIVSLGYLSQFAIASLAPGFAESNPWFPGPLWGTLATVGMVGSGIIGHRAGRQNMAGKAARSAGIRVFLFWLAVMGAAFLVPGAAGLWNAGDTGDSIARVAVGIVSLGYILFGIMHRPGHRGNRRRDRGVLLYPELPRGRGRGGRFGGSHAGGSPARGGMDTQ